MKKKNIDAERDALSIRLRMYFQYFNADSAVIAGKEAIHFARQHRLYDDMFASYQNLIKVYNAQGQTLIALRSAEEAYSEARELQDKMQMARILHVMAEIYYTVGQNDLAFRYFSECLEPVQQGDSQQQKLVDSLRDCLLENAIFTQPDVNADTLAATLATNRTYLFKAVKNVTGSSLQEYINDMRIDEARRMLENNPELTIENIAEDCGFIQLRTFYRNFKERYQMSPAQYRKIAKG